MARVIKTEEKTYVVEEGNGKVIRAMKAYNHKGIDVLVPYLEGTRTYMVNNNKDEIVHEDLMGRITPMGTEREYLDKMDIHTMRILSVLAT